MAPRNADQLVLVCLLLACFHLKAGSAQTDAHDDVTFLSLVSGWKNKPSNWVGSDPCAGGWVGVKCDSSRIVSIELSSMGLQGTLTGDIGSLTELQRLDLSYNLGMNGVLPAQIGALSKLTTLILVGCSFFGEIPDLTGLKELTSLSLNLNQFTGSIPPSIGSLSKLYWLDLADNMLTGEIPVSTGSTPGLDNLTHTAHFHFGNNRISGRIPARLFSSEMKLIHLLFDNNSLEGPIPSTLGLVQKLEVIRLDSNTLEGSIPNNINNLTSLGELYLSNNKFTGTPPNLSGMAKLSYVDLSNNTFEQTDVPGWFSSLDSLTTIIMENLRIKGQLPPDMFSIPQLQTVRLMKNLLNGTLNISNSYSNQLQLVDLRNNNIEFVVQGSTYNHDLLLQGNPYCRESANDRYCLSNLVESTSTYSTPRDQQCAGRTCSPSDLDLSPRCLCAYPYTGTLYFRAPAFSDINNSSRYGALELKLTSVMSEFVPAVGSVSLHNIIWAPTKYLGIDLMVFPGNSTAFSQSDVAIIGFTLSNQTFKPPPGFGPFYFRGQSYLHFSDVSSGSNSKSTNLAVIIGACAGGLVLAAIIVVLAIYGIRQRRRARTAETKSQPFATWDPTKTSGTVPQLKGARCFTFDEMKRFTKNFSEDSEVGSGGYGKVYRGVLEDGQLVAIKRAGERSVQGASEFKTEIELLSRVHHRNLVTLVGFCFDKGEQMLVYEYIPNGSLRDSLTGRSRVKLDWRRRLRVALGSARGLAYLHELADPPIVHRDVKSSNILIDNLLIAKVADFGLCKSLGDGDKTHVTTQVKGTMGYLDPEYYMTQQLTHKSDVYSFGVLLLELITARQPIERGHYIVREVKNRKNTSRDLYGLHELLDPNLVSNPNLDGFGRFIDLALWCVKEEGGDRPSMGEVVKEIESIMQSVGINPNMDSAPSSASYDGSNTSKEYHHPYSNEAITSYGTSMSGR